LFIPYIAWELLKSGAWFRSLCSCSAALLGKTTRKIQTLEMPHGFSVAKIANKLELVKNILITSQKY
jgi:hypothetical protein